MTDKDMNSGTRLWFKDTDYKKPKDKILPEKYAALFSNKQIVCVEYSDLTEDTEREIFMRVQMGMALTPAEKMASISSPWARLVRLIMNDYVSADPSSRSDDDDEGLDWDHSRGRDFQNVAHCIYVIYKFNAIIHSPAMSLGTQTQVERWLNGNSPGKDADNAPPTEEFERSVQETFLIFLHLLRTDALSRSFKRKERIAPIEFIMINVLISQWKNKTTLKVLAERIGGMRDRVREEHVDIRSNAKVTKTAMGYLKDMMRAPGANGNGGSKDKVAVPRLEAEEESASDAIKRLDVMPHSAGSQRDRSRGGMAPPPTPSASGSSGSGRKLPAFNKRKTEDDDYEAPSSSRTASQGSGKRTRFQDGQGDGGWGGSNMVSLPPLAVRSALGSG